MLSEFKQSIDEYKHQTEINSLEVNNAIKTASKLASMLSSNQNLKGQFGEDCLENVLKTCFLNQNIDYIKQYRTKNEQDVEIKPDFLVNLPNDKSIFIDCKLNLDKYIEYIDCDYELKNSKKNDFIKDLNETINDLFNKKYETAQNVKQPDFILMYVPIESIATLIYTDKDFLSVVGNANQKNIIIVSNSSIITIIRLVKLLWASYHQEKNIEKIVSISQKIYEFIANHTNNLAHIKENMEKNMNDFYKEYNKITSDKLFKLTCELKEYGIQTKIKKEGRKIAETELHNDFL